MPRYEYIDHEGNAHVLSASSLFAAGVATRLREYERTGSLCLADRASGTVEPSDERSRAAWSTALAIDDDEAARLLAMMSPPDALIAFGRALDEAHGGLDWPYFLAKPWKWSGEFVAWHAAGRPGLDDDGFWSFSAKTGAR